MTLPEKLYMLRKKSGLSQEQLAEKLGVSRQAVSKWEGGQSIPEIDKIVYISKFFNVTTDYLIKDESETEMKTIETAVCIGNNQERGNKRKIDKSEIIGLVIATLGSVGFVIFAILMIFDVQAKNRYADSSVIILDGMGILFLLCIILTAVGIVLFLRKNKK